MSGLNGLHDWLNSTRWTSILGVCISAKRAAVGAFVVHNIFCVEKNSHIQTNKAGATLEPSSVCPQWDQRLHWLSLRVDNNNPYTLFVIDGRAVTFHLRPLGADLTSGLTSWDTCNDTGIHLMTPGRDRGQWWKVKSRCPSAAVTPGSGRDLLINWANTQLRREK